MTPYNLCSSRS